MIGDCRFKDRGKTDFIKKFIKIVSASVFICILHFSPWPASVLHQAFASLESHQAQDSDFPLYPAIKPNVDFWVSIFTRYSKAHGVIHDINNLAIIYEVVSLDPSETPAAAAFNQKAKADAISKYKDILLNLSKGTPAVSSDESQVAALFGPQASPADFELAAASIRCQTGLSKEFKEGLIRAGAVLDEFRRIFKSYGLPQDLVYLPCVESSYNFNAYSKLGAAGIWQFTYDTGKMFMNIDYTVDERRDPYISTDAAARLLKKNYEVLREWPLAITAYNHGLTGMIRAKNAAGDYENIFKTYQGPAFRFASRNFYSEFLAARMVAKNFEKHFGNIRLQAPASFHTVTTKGFITAKDLTEKFGITSEEIQTLNPSLRPPVFTEQKYIPKGFHLKLPKTYSIYEIENRLAHLYKSDQKPSRFHKVQKGDTALSIAKLYSIRLLDLINANDLGSKATLILGQNLRIPVKDEAVAAVKKEPATKPTPLPLPKPKPESAPELVKKPIETETAVAKAPEAPAVHSPSSASAPSASSAPEPANSVNGPQPQAGAGSSPQPVGEPLPTPAVTAATAPPIETPVLPASEAPADQIAQTQSEQTPETLDNSIFNSVAQPLPETAAVNPKLDISELKILQIESSGNLPVGIIKVEAEETLGHFAGWLKVSTLDIRKLNAFTPKDHLSIGRTIKIPLKKTTAQAFEEQRYEFHKEIEEDFFQNYTITGMDTYEIKNGDNIWRLCENELEVPVWLLKKYNPDLNLNALQPKQKIKYPLIAKTKGK